jgi:hypothetical protein
MPNHRAGLELAGKMIGEMEDHADADFPGGEASTNRQARHQIFFHRNEPEIHPRRRLSELRDTAADHVNRADGFETQSSMGSGQRLCSRHVQ